MIREDHLEVYDLKLKVRSPLFIGNGKKYLKSDYIFVPEKGTVSIVDFNKLSRMLAEQHMVDEYVRAVLETDFDLYSFLQKTCQISPAEIEFLCKYTVSAADALDENHSLKEIHSFVRREDGKPYIPGSSVKGALRTVLLYRQIQISKMENTFLSSPADKKLPEEKYLNILKLQGIKENDMLASIMRGISLSDSTPIDEGSFILAGKSDLSTNQFENCINVCRECLKPGTTVQMKLTLDHSALPDWLDAKTLLQAIDDFSHYYQDTFVAGFSLPDAVSTVEMGQSLIMGGGSGFFSKTLAYQYWEWDDAVRNISQNMANVFKKHKHEKDSEIGISPHMLKYTRYRGNLVPMGICGVELT